MYVILSVVKCTVVTNFELNLLFLVSDRRLKIPQHIEQNVLRNNVEFMHLRSHFSVEYFQFVKRLVGTNSLIFSNPVEEISRV